MTDPGYYDQSIPPALLLGAPRRVAGRAPAGGTAARTAPPAQADQQPSPLLVSAGGPGAYSPAGKATDRPRNVTELNSTGAVADPFTPWTAGQYVPVGTSGKRAHWNGEEWRGGESPGYPATPVNEGPAADMATAPAARHAAPEEEPVAEAVDDMPQDAARMSPPPLPPAPYTAGTQFPGDEQPGDLTR